MLYPFREMLRRLYDHPVAAIEQEVGFSTQIDR